MSSPGDWAGHDMATINGDDDGNTLVGTADDDIINGFAGEDVIDGGDGDDFIDGGADFDGGDWRSRGQAFTFTLDGFTNTAVSFDETETDTFERLERVFGTNFGDVYNIGGGFTADSGDFISLRLGAGDDIVNNDGEKVVRIEYLSASAGVTVDLSQGTAESTDPNDAAGIGSDTFSNIHRVRGSNFDDILIGTDSGGFFEQFEGRGGSDSIDGGGGTNNEVRYSFHSEAIVADLVAGTVDKGSNETDTIQNIQRVRGSAFGDTISGDDAANRLQGEAGDDEINGGGAADTLQGDAGDDVLSGGAGDDFIIGGDDDDTIDGGSDFDTVDYRDRGQAFTFTLTAFTNFATSADLQETDTLERVEGIFGSDNGDTYIIESTFEADFDNFVSLRLGAGDDDITNDTAAVRIDYRSAAAGVTVDLAAGTGASTAANDAAGVGSDTFSNIHRVRGSEFGDTILGSDSGGAFEDFEGRGGDDLIDGVGGTNNQANYAASPNRVVVDLSANEASEDGRGGSDQLFNIQHIRATDNDDILAGDDQGNFFRPGLGDDTITGGDGFDTGDYRFDSSSPITFTLASTTTAVGDDIGTDTYTEVERFKGGTGADIFNADLDFVGRLSNVDGLGVAFNAFEGREGDDVINGNGITRIEYFGAASGIDADLQRGTVIGDGNIGTDTVSGIASVVGTDFNDTLSGTDNNPTSGRFALEEFRGGGGDDVIDGRGGRDRLAYDFSNNGVGIVADLEDGTITDGFGNIDTFFNIEGLRGSDFDDDLAGDDEDNNFEPDAGDDVVDGRGGDDVVFYDNQTAGVTVDLENETADDGEGGTDTLISVEHVDGSVFDDVIVGSTANNILLGRSGSDQISGGAGDDVLEGDAGDDVLDGGAGADEMDGGLGDDTFVVDDVGDVLSDAGGTDSVIASIAFNLAGGFENLEFTSDAGDVDGNGNSLDNVITGSDGANFIKASGGNDTVEGGAGDDTLNGQSGDDILIGGDGLDFLTGKIGDDMLFGGADNDQLRGEEGDDHMEGGGAKDRMIGKANDDVLLGQEANDKLFGNGGEDVIVGGVGKDSMNGGADADIFILAPGDQVDTIKDFEVGLDQLDISAFGFESFAEVEALMKEKNGRVQINLDGSDDVVRLNGVLQADLSEGDFILS